MFCKEKVSFYIKKLPILWQRKFTSVMIYNIDLFQRIACEYAPYLYGLLLLIHE